MNPSGGGEKMNKKVLMLTVTFILIAMISTSIVGTAQASRTVETFPTTPFEELPTLTNMEQVVPGTPKYVCDGTVRIAKGSVRKYDYKGPLGTGTFYLESIISITKVSGMIELLPGYYENITGHGKGIYKYTLIIDDGPYGTGTLKGVGKLEFEWNYAEIPPRYEQWDTAMLKPVTGNLNIIKVYLEGYSRFPIGWWWTTTTIVS